MDIFISDAYIPTSRGMTIGYIYITEGKIAEVGEGSAPEDLYTSQICYPVSGGIALRGLSSPLTSLLSFWARGLMPSKITYDQAINQARRLSNNEKALIALSKLNYLISKGFTLFGILLEDIEIAQTIEERANINIVWIAFEDYKIDDLKSHVIIGYREESRVPYLTIHDTGPSSIIWKDSSKSLCHDEFNQFSHEDSACIVNSYQPRFPKWVETFLDKNNHLPFHITSGNAYRQILDTRVSIELKKGEDANLVVLNLNSPQLSGLSPDEVLRLFYCGLLSPPSIELVISSGNVLLEYGESLIMDLQSNRAVGTLMKKMREKVLR